MACLGSIIISQKINIQFIYPPRIKFSLIIHKNSYSIFSKEDFKYSLAFYLTLFCFILLKFMNTGNIMENI